jgi:hypothetical protein
MDLLYGYGRLPRVVCWWEGEPGLWRLHLRSTRPIPHPMIGILDGITPGVMVVTSAYLLDGRGLFVYLTYLLARTIFTFTFSHACPFSSHPNTISKSSLLMCFCCSFPAPTQHQDGCHRYSSPNLQPPTLLSRTGDIEVFTKPVIMPQYHPSLPTAASALIYA